MVSIKQLTIESLIIGLVFAILYIVIHFLLMKINKDYSMSHQGLVVAAFTAAVLFHVGAEYTGLNKKFCDELR